MLKIFRRVGRAKKIGVLNFFLLVIIVMILGFSFLFIHEDSYSLNNYLFKSNEFYALKEPPLKIKRSSNGEELHLFDFLSPEQFKDIVFQSHKSSILKTVNCERLFNSKDRNWMGKIRLQVAESESCQSLFQLRPRGTFLPWPNHLFVEIVSDSDCAGQFVISLNLPAQNKLFDFSGFQSLFSAPQALTQAKLKIIEVVDLECAP